MKIQTFSVVAGTKACQAKCPFCVSKMTGFAELPPRSEFNSKLFGKAARLAQIGRCTDVLITGKGEPTLYPDEISDWLRRLEPWRFPYTAIQTNALDMGRLAAGETPDAKGFTVSTLKDWWTRGLDTIAISVVGITKEHNAPVYLGEDADQDDYPDLKNTIAYLKDLGFSIRLCLMMHKKGIWSWRGLKKVIDFCRDNEVEQLTARPLRSPSRATHSVATSDYVDKHSLTPIEEELIARCAREYGSVIGHLMHGATIFDVDGQNLCLSDCLTINKPKDGPDIRTLIFYPDGRTTWDWAHKGAVLIGGNIPKWLNKE